MENMKDENKQLKSNLIDYVNKNYSKEVINAENEKDRLKEVISDISN